MDLDAAWAVGRGVMVDTMGVPAVITRPAPNDTPIETSVVWLGVPDQNQPFGSDLTRRDPRRHLAVARDADLPGLPRGSVIVAAERLGGTEKTWRVDGYAQPVTSDEMRLIVIEVER